MWLPWGTNRNLITKLYYVHTFDDTTSWNKQYWRDRGKITSCKYSVLLTVPSPSSEQTGYQAETVGAITQAALMRIGANSTHAHFVIW